MSPQAVWEGKAQGLCPQLAGVYAYYMGMAGVKHVVIADKPNDYNNHVMNVVRLQNGRIYLLNYHNYSDYQEVSLDTTGGDGLFDIV